MIMVPGATKVDGVVKSPICGVIVFVQTFDIRSCMPSLAKHYALPMALFP